MKKILCISLGYEGGCLYYANKLIDNLRSDKDVWISYQTLSPNAAACKRLKIRGGIKNVVLNTLFNLPFYVVAIIKGLISQRWSCVIVFGPNIWDGVFLGLFRLFGKKGYYVIHDGLLHDGENDWFHQTLTKASMRAASNHIFLSDNVRSLVQEQLGIVRPFTIVPHGIIAYNNTCLIQNEGVLKYDYEQSRPRFLMIGRINKYKGIDLLFEAVKSIDFSKIDCITIAGFFADNVVVPEYVKLNPQIRLINKYLTDEEFDSLMSSHDYLLMPYLEATQSGIAAASIGYELPAIVTKVGAMEEQFGSAAIYMDAITPEALTSCIDKVINNEKTHEDIQVRLRLKKQELSWESLGEKLKNIVDENIAFD